MSNYSLSFSGGFMRKFRTCSFVPLLIYSLSSQAQGLDDLKNLSLEDFSNLDVVVTSLSRKPQKLMDAAAAVYVISNEDIQRSGATNIPEALRLAPGVEVAQINASTWSITSRGFPGRFAKKLLVLMDGRTIYTSVFSGVYWDMQDTLLEDIDRIEVIRGPATAVWGGNAMNGVINIITKSAQYTQGGLLTTSLGTEVEGQAGMRYGGKLGEDFFYRVYGKYKENDSSVDASDIHDSFDENDLGQMGYRVDWKLSEENTFVFHGDIYNGEVEQRQPVAVLTPAVGVVNVDKENEVSGFNMLGQWTHQVSESSSWSLQAYYDRAKRQNTATVDTKVDTLDIDFKHQFTLAEQHHIVWGAGYRQVLDDLSGKLGISFTPDRRRTHRYNAFFHDEFVLYPDKFSLIVGSQFEHNDFTGFEIQPSIRAKLNIDEQSLAWASVSKGLSIPDRSTEDVRVDVRAVPGAPPILVAFVGQEHMEPEEVVAYEMGYRTFFGKGNLFDISLFYNEYSHLRTNELGTPFVEATPAPFHVVQPIVGGFDKKAESYGLELVAEWVVNSDLTLKGHYSYFELDSTPASTTTAATPERDEGLSPQHQASLRTLYQISDAVTFDTWLRYVDALPSNAINNYVDVDIKLTWQPSQQIEFSLVGQNLLEGARLEYQDDIISNIPTQVERGVYVKALLRF
jgi:iron complex outermembrane receptor protein